MVDFASWEKRLEQKPEFPGKGEKAAPQKGQKAVGHGHQFALADDEALNGFRVGVYGMI